jgi:hypothetical protein
MIITPSAMVFPPAQKLEEACETASTQAQGHSQEYEYEEDDCEDLAGQSSMPQAIPRLSWAVTRHPFIDFAALCNRC